MGTFMFTKMCTHALIYFMVEGFGICYHHAFHQIFPVLQFSIYINVEGDIFILAGMCMHVPIFVSFLIGLELLLLPTHWSSSWNLITKNVSYYIKKIWYMYLEQWQGVYFCVPKMYIHVYVNFFCALTYPTIVQGEKDRWCWLYCILKCSD